MQVAAWSGMKLSPFAVVSFVAIVLAQSACSSDMAREDSLSSADALVEETDAEGPTDEALADAEADAELGPDPEPMVTDAEIEAAASRPDEEHEAEAERELGDVDAPFATEPPAATITAITATAAAAKVRCKKRIHVTFAVYTSLTEKLGSNGCWTSEDTVSDPSFRNCHADGSVKHASGNKWFYDDTNPRNPLARERQVIDDCAKGRVRGYEYMAFRDGSWRFIGHRHTSAYFAELYTDDAHIDDLWYQSSVYRTNSRLRRHRRVAPMLNFAPFPDGRYSQHQIGREILKVCKTVRNHGFLGLYEWHYPLPAGSPRLRGMVHALNACTRR